MFIVYPTRGKCSCIQLSVLTCRCECLSVRSSHIKQHHHNIEFVQTGTVEVLLYFGCPLLEGSVIGLYCCVAAFFLSTIP
jgi:hypothetical protein